MLIYFSFSCLLRSYVRKNSKVWYGGPMDYQISDKTNRVLNFILLCLLLILIRVWYLSSVQREEHVENARRPQRRTQIERSERATIRDRFNIPLALNKIQYNAAVCYADVRQIPSVRWKRDETGKRIRVQERVEHIKKLASLLANELQMDPQKIEDTIHGKASLFPHTPFVIKEDLSEKEYYRLKGLEREWAGLYTERTSKRYYPKGKCAADVIGFMGAISAKEYCSIAQELSELSAYLAEREAGNTPMLPKGFSNPFQVEQRLKQLQEKAYTINDFVGKTGVEATFDSELRGYAGKKSYEIDIKGNILRELPGNRKAIPGQRLLLSISSELQEYAEQLLAENEAIREVSDAQGNPLLTAPWIKGGAIVAMDPQTGEVLALASYPRIDLNDFAASKMRFEENKKIGNLHKWLEDETCLGEIWEGRRPLERERFDNKAGEYYEEKLFLSWEKYLEAILAPNCAARAAMKKIKSIRSALRVQKAALHLLKASAQDSMHILFAVLYPHAPHRQGRCLILEEEKQRVKEELAKLPDFILHKELIDEHLGDVFHNDDKILVLDLCRLLVDPERFTEELIDIAGDFSLSHYHHLMQSKLQIQAFLQEKAKQQFLNVDFLKWRKAHFQNYLKEKRKEEKEKKTHARPYTDYLYAKEKELFHIFWEKERYSLLREFIFNKNGVRPEKIPDSIQASIETLKSHLCALDPEQQLSFFQTMRSFTQMQRPLWGRYRQLRHAEGVQQEKHLAAAFYPSTGYGYGRSQAYRQATPQGSVFKLVVAYQALVEKYHLCLQQNQRLNALNPLTLIDELKWHPQAGSKEQILGYTLDGEPITRFYKGGKLPRSHANIGKIDLIGALEQSSNIYFSILAAENIQDPTNLIHTTRQLGFGDKTGIELPGEIVGTLPDDLTHNKTGLYAFAIGQHSLVVTPLQTAVMFSSIVNKGRILKPTIVQVIAGQEPLRDYRDPFAANNFPFKEALNSIGIEFPLFTSLQKEAEEPRVWYLGQEVKRSLLMPDSIRSMLLEGMHRVIAGPKGTARPEIIRALHHNPAYRRDYHALKEKLIGKTGTAEILYAHSLDRETQAKIQNHIWFGGATLDTSHELKESDLVVVVYLRFSEAGGKEAAPLAVEIMHKWRDICAKHGKRGYVSLEGVQ